ncbi:MAG: taurine dioxygenase [Gammaproteobacteria bacterium]|nr:taurine dioxygenase [Gammaproteobacteria bacterium]
MNIDPITPAIGASISGIGSNSFSDPLLCDEIYQALLKHQVIFIPQSNLKPSQHLAFAENFGTLDDPHLHYPHVEGYANIVLLENDQNNPPDTNSWHTDLTFKAIQPFASILIARHIPASGGDTMWSSCYAAYDRLPEGMKNDLENLQAVHDFGDFRNSFVSDQDGQSGVERLNLNVSRFGHNIRPLIDSHPVTGRKFLNFNEAFVTHIAGMTTNDSNALRTFLANHMNKPEDQVRWRWSVGDLVMWDNRVTMHYALADYMPHYRCMNRITVVHDRRAPDCS